MRGRKSGRMITRFLAWMLTVVVLCTSVPVDGMRVYAEEEAVSDEKISYRAVDVDDGNNLVEENGMFENDKELLDENVSDNQDNEKRTDDIDVVEDVEDLLETESIESEVLAVESYASESEIFTLLYRVDDAGNAIITGYSGKPTHNLTIPESIDSHQVVEIANYAFRIIWDDDGNFTGKLVLPKTLKTIGENAFEKCEFTGKLTIPENVIRIGCDAFSGCKKITEIELPKGIYLSDNCFYDCDSLESIEIPEDSSIGMGTFANCDNLSSVYIPKTAKHVRPQYSYGSPFADCDKLLSAGSIGSECNIQYDYDVIPEGLFWGNSLETVIISNKVKRIENHAFADCSNLVTLDLSEGLEYIGRGAFSNCGHLEEVIIPSSVKKIGVFAFQGCSNLNHIVVPGSVVRDGDYLVAGSFFEGTPQLKTAGPIGSGCDIEFGWKTAIPEFAFYGSSIEEISLPNTLLTIGMGAFYSCKNLSYISIPGGVTEIPDFCFIRSGLKRIKLPKSLKTINQQSFSWCENLAYIYLPDSITKIEDWTWIPNRTFPIGCTLACSGKDNYVLSFIKTFSNDYNMEIGEETTENVNESLDGSLVDYELNGGVNNENNSSLIPAGKRVNLFNPSKDGYTFVGWYKDSNLKTKVTYITGKKGTNYTLYAKWAVETYKVTYMLPKGVKNGKNNPTSYKITDLNKKLNNATLTGYEFAGWYTEEECLNRVYEIKSGSHGNLKLYTKWKPHTYTIKYNSNGGTGGSTSNTTHKYKTSGTVAACGFTKAGYNVAKWNTKSNGKGKTYAAGYDKNDLTTTDGEVIDFYAQWVANTYTVTYNGNGATSGKTSNTTMTFDKSGTLAKNGFKKTGYTFVEWNTKADGTGKSYGAGKKATYNLTSVNNGTVILYAIWKPIQYKIVFKMPDNSFQISNIAVVKYDEDVVLPSCDSTYKGCYFVGWSLKTDGSTGVYGTKQSVRNLTTGSSVTLYPIWNYDINFDANGGDGTMSTQQMPYNKSTALVKSTFTRTGYEFAGWETTIDGRVKKLKDNEGVKNLFNSNGAKVVLKAVWKANTYEVWFTEENDKGASSKKIVKATYDKDFTIPANTVARKNYDFVGWNTKSDGSGKYYFPGDIVKNLTVDSICMPLYAIWTKRVEVKEITADESINITLSNGSVDLNGKVVISPENATNKKLNWTIVSQNPTGCATIDTTTGVLTPKKEGTVKVKATATDGSGKTKEIEISIIKCTKVVFPLDTAINWKCFTYSGHGNAYKSAYSSLDINKKDDSSAEGYKVYAMAAGEVVSIMDSNGQVVIKHSSPLITTNGVEYKAWYSLYAHMKNISVSVGNKIDAGQQIGLTSMVGNASGPHLHINIMSAEDGVSWSQNNDIKYAISPYYVYGIVDSDGNDMPYLTCDREGPVTEERLINHKPSK